MQYITPLDKFHPSLQPVLQEFARKSHARNLLVVGNISSVHPDTGESVNYQKAYFYDPRFPRGERSGEWEHNAVGYVKVWEDGFVVASRLIRNEKYRRDSHDYMTKSSKNVAKVLKTMVDFIVLYRYSEIFEFHKRRMEDLVHKWRNEKYKTVQLAFGYFSVEQKVLVEEAKHLRDMGVQFKTNAFNLMITEGIDAYEEHERRQKQPLVRYHILVVDNKISVTKREEDQSLVASLPRLAYVCEGFEMLEDDVAAEVAMLKMLDVGKEILGVGVRVSERDYLVIKPLASTTNA